MPTVKYCMSVQLNKDNPVATPSAATAPLDSYTRLGLRVSKIINAPTAQKAVSYTHLTLPTIYSV